MVEIIAGTYGRNVNGRIVPITASDGPVELGGSIERELIESGMARAVDCGPKAAAEMSVPEIQSELTALGIDYKKTARKAELAKLLEAARNAPADDGQGPDGAKEPDTSADKGQNPDGTDDGAQDPDDPAEDGQEPGDGEQPPVVDAQTAE